MLPSVYLTKVCWVEFVPCSREADFSMRLSLRLLLRTVCYKLSRRGTITGGIMCSPG